MNITRKLYPIARHNFGKGVCKNFRILPVKYESTQATQPQVKEEKYSFEDLKVLERTVNRKPRIEPFMKNVFTSNFNSELLAYPEVLSKEDRQELDQRVEKLEKVFKDPNKSHNDRREALKIFRMFAAPAKLTHNGLAMNVTERLRYLETVSTDLNLSQELSDHWIGLELLQKGLTEEDYNKLLPEILDGDLTITLCLKEPMASRITEADFKTTAELDKNSVWRVNGQKECYKVSGFLLVLAMKEGSRFGVYLIHPNAHGVSYHEPFVAFRDAPATPIDLISDEEMSSVIALSRLDTATICHSVLKQTILKCVEFSREKHFDGKPIAELPTIRARIGEALMTLYASESATYFTAGLLDSYESPDAQLEMAMCKTFIVNHGLQSMLSLLNINGLQLQDAFVEKLNHFRSLAYKQEVDDQANSYIALNGLHHAGLTMSEEVRQIRNPLQHPGFFFKKVFSNRRQENDDPKLILYLSEHLHPSLKGPAEMLEYCVLRMRYASECLMSRHGHEVSVAMLDINRLGKAATEILIMTASLGRASRSYCIGLRNAEVEMKLAAAITEKTKPIVRQLIIDIENGDYLNLDLIKTQVGQKVLNTSTTLVEKAIERVFW